MSMFTAKPDAADLRNRQVAIYWDMQEAYGLDEPSARIRELAAEMVLLAGYYFLHAEQLEAEPPRVDIRVWTGVYERR